MRIVNDSLWVMTSLTHYLQIVLNLNEGGTDRKHVIILCHLTWAFKYYMSLSHTLTSHITDSDTAVEVTPGQRALRGTKLDFTCCVICPLITDVLTLYQGFIYLNQQGFICNSVFLSLSLFKYTFFCSLHSIICLFLFKLFKTNPLNPCPLNTNDIQFHTHIKYTCDLSRLGTVECSLTNNKQNINLFFFLSFSQHFTWWGNLASSYMKVMKVCNVIFLSLSMRTQGNREIDSNRSQPHLRGKSMSKTASHSTVTLFSVCCHILK